ncbi:DUF402 domain-containing protein [Miltoncostaea marina]|uniref:DUF402 domain-containing protein n=1 Tax=Miltoncostaea marina TaxID=2843215 RepID=UPI001C3DF91B|nr:DUF402 domain-containing protein [Miltoncostaea marina]
MPPRTVTVEKRKWDGSVSARWRAALLSAPPGPWLWRTPAGTRREHPRRGETETVAHDEVAAACDEWWVVTATLGPGGAVEGWTVDAALPVEAAGADVVAFVDLDLDLAVAGGRVRLEDEDDFHRRAREMGYPEEVCSGAWGGLRDAVRRHAAGEWPFDGTVAGGSARPAGPTPPAGPPPRSGR